MNEFICGADIGWATQLESMGYYWTDDAGNKKDILEILKGYGTNAIRFRLFVNPPATSWWQKNENENVMLGFCDTNSVIEASKRVVKAGMKLMLDFHYSDVFADPQHQHIPAAWEGHSVTELINDVREYTLCTLRAFKDNEITPDWIQVGNEINPGMMLPVGDSTKAMEVLVSFLNAGYEAVKEVFPDTAVITHLASGGCVNEITTWFDRFFECGGKTDIIGLSHYPYWNKITPNMEFTDLGNNMLLYYKKYAKPIMVVEVGEDESEWEECYRLITKTILDLKAIPDNNGLGVFYWEPDVGRDVLKDGYPLGASQYIGEKDIRFTRALSAFCLK